MSRIVVIDRELCKPGKCTYECKRFCPVNRKGEECIIADAGRQPTINEELCIGCGICVKKCPFSALSVVNLPEALNENPVHRFGENDFALFRLPIPVKGVVGLLGANGVGKTTALKILSGYIKPNLGVDGNNDGTDELIKIQRGTELQDYLNKMKEKKITAIYKPQQVSLLAKEDKKVNELNIKEGLIAKLELEGCRDKKLNQLSGGELQRVAISLAVSKDADIYYFDEPSSFLDVKQRINVAKVLRELSEDKFVMVVEHDLATLDLLADRIHIFYGEPGVYGIVSKPYSAKKGINIFLSGYISEDNIRIRDETVFENVTEEKREKAEILTEFRDIRKSLGNFTLEINEGYVHKEEVLGVFGSNALGKTTFAKILADIMPHRGKITNKIIISYKPQYIESDFEGSVRELLATEKNTNGKEFRILARQLDIEKLMERTVKNLSGGELQRISIALCLSRDCDLFLLDEPSAYLDVDQRLAVAKVIKGRTVMVIDHDLMFLNYVSDRALLFLGEPGLHGNAKSMTLKDGFNKFLKDVNVTFRKDPETKRMRANKPDSAKDREQKDDGEYYSS